MHFSEDGSRCNLGAADVCGHKVAVHEVLPLPQRASEVRLHAADWWIFLSHLLHVLQDSAYASPRFGKTHGQDDWKRSAGKSCSAPH